MNKLGRCNDRKVGVLGGTWGRVGQDGCLQSEEDLRDAWTGSERISGHFVPGIKEDACRVETEER
jgi:hypothetical protein